MIQTQTEGRRTYVTGDTYPHREALRAAGAHWDGDRKAWWLGDAAKAEQLAADLGGANPAAREHESAGEPKAPGESAVVAGKGDYKGKTYYLAGRIVRGRRSPYDDRVAAVESRDGAKVLLYSRDGSLQFWGARAAVTVTRRYDRPQTIGSLKSFAEGMRNGTVPVCRYCGSPSCDGARGGHCEED